MSFSIPQHIPLLLDGRKVQTTRQPRKNPLKVGDVLYCYYKPRHKKSCWNCINLKCENALTGRSRDITLQRIVEGSCFDITPCENHNNYFGKAEIIDINRVRRVPDSTSSSLFCTWRDVTLEEWAKDDGFEGFYYVPHGFAAQDWFYKSTGRTDWKELDWDIIKFEPGWLK